jgi:hypothetical protein
MSKSADCKGCLAAENAVPIYRFTSSYDRRSSMYVLVEHIIYTRKNHFHWR